MIEPGARIRVSRRVLLGMLALTAGAGSMLAASGAAMAEGSAARQPTAAADAAESGSRPEAVIPFASFNIYDWAADGTRGIYIQTLNRKWYYAKLFAPCINLPFALRVGFVTEPGNSQFNRFSSIIVQGQQCLVESLTKSGPPPAKDKRWRERQATRKAERQGGSESHGASR